jgi:hypothetical protein
MAAVGIGRVGVHADLVLVDLLWLEADADADSVCHRLALTGAGGRRRWGGVATEEREGGLASCGAMGASSGSGDGEVRMQRPGEEGTREKWRQVMD